jgi:hypothetical protein
MLFFKPVSKTILTIICLLISFSFVNAQSKNIIRVKNGQDAANYASSKDRYQYPEFQAGTIHFTNGRTGSGRLNYCYLLGEIMLINDKGDTLALADNNLVRYADIGKTHYYYIPENGYAEMVENCGMALLVKKVKYQISSIEKKGAYQSPDDTGSLYNASTYTDVTGRTIILSPNNTVLLKPVVSYFFRDANHRFNKATKNNLLKIFSKKKAEIAPYLEEQNFNYLNEEDLRKAIRYCSAL